MYLSIVIQQGNTVLVNNKGDLGQLQLLLTTAFVCDIERTKVDKQRRHDEHIYKPGHLRPASEIDMSIYFRFHPHTTPERQREG